MAAEGEAGVPPVRSDGVVIRRDSEESTTRGQAGGRRQAEDGTLRRSGGSGGSQAGQEAGRQVDRRRSPPGVECPCIGSAGDGAEGPLHRKCRGDSCIGSAGGTGLERGGRCAHPAVFQEVRRVRGAQGTPSFSAPSDLLRGPTSARTPTRPQGGDPQQ